jgi:ActR/RegA family two-component response regulator
MASKRILIVDDEENIGRSLRMILEREGYAVAICRSVAEFRKNGDTQRADAFLFDMRLPDGSGIDLLRSLQQNDSRAPAIMISGHGTIADAVEEALRAVKVRPAHVEGYKRAEWILMDFFTFIVHVFTPQTREFYSLERLWGDAERIEVSDEVPSRGE